ncbi:MAG: Hsp33 family molecular chaperone HslO [Paracoccaceae bacterium]
MASVNELIWDDTVLPFQLDGADMRGRMARLDASLGEMLAQHDYPKQVRALVAEAVLLAALIGQTMKLRWRFSLQIHGDGPLRMIVADYYAPAAKGEAARMRAYATFDAGRLLPEAAPYSQLGKGTFGVMIDQGEGMAPYQGITPLVGASLADCAETYFAQSEQLPTRFALTINVSDMAGESAARAGGIMLQHLPKAALHAQGDGGSARDGLLTGDDLVTGDDAENWTRATTLLATVNAAELSGPALTPDQVLLRLFHEEMPRIYDAQPVRFGCSCSQDAVRNSLSIYSAKDIATMTTSEGTVTADCHFCGAHYALDPETLGFEARKPAH